MSDFLKSLIKNDVRIEIGEKEIPFFKKNIFENKEVSYSYA